MLGMPFWWPCVGSPVQSPLTRFAPLPHDAATESPLAKRNQKAAAPDAPAFAMANASLFSPRRRRRLPSSSASVAATAAAAAKAAAAAWPGELPARLAELRLVDRSPSYREDMADEGGDGGDNEIDGGRDQHGGDSEGGGPVLLAPEACVARAPASSAKRRALHVAPASSNESELELASAAAAPPPPVPRARAMDASFQCNTCGRHFASAPNLRSHFFCLTKEELASFAERRPLDPRVCT